MEKVRKFNRREFVKKTITGTATFIGAGLVMKLPAHPVMPVSEENAASSPEYRVLGETGMKYTTLGFGAMRTSDPAVIRRALEMGVNNIDTARGYMDGQNEAIVGRAVKGIREDIHITTKIKHVNLSQMERDIDTSLSTIGTDYVDVLLLHSLSSPDQLHNQEYRQVLTKAKQAGKARAVGFSTHNNMAALLEEAARDDFFDVVLTAYNFKHPEEMTRAIDLAAKSGVGVIAMKTQAGGYQNNTRNGLNPHQAALKWVLSHQSVTNAIPSMVTYREVEENFQVMGSSFGWNDRKTLYHYGNAIDTRLCRLCDICLPQCPNNVQLSDINRSVMYADGYQDPDLAATNYSDIPAAHNLSQCESCDTCPVQCRFGLDINANLARARELFA